RDLVLVVPSLRTAAVLVHLDRPELVGREGCGRCPCTDQAPGSWSPGRRRGEGSGMTTRKRSEIDQLVRTAEQARRRRAHDVHPDVVALRVERVRTQVDRLMWAGIVLGLAFTATNVAQFAAAGTEPWTPEWAIGWLLDPMVSL